MDIRTIDWNRAWKKQQPGTCDEGRDRVYWDNRAPQFAESAEGGPYVKRLLELMDPESHWRVLDVGCASGTVAVPLSSCVRQVTALDISPVMLDCLQARCRQRQIENIHPVQASWMDDWHRLGVEPHDLVVASRSLIVPDLRQAVEKLNHFALRRVCISTPVGSGPLDPDMFRAIGRTRNCGPDYIYVYNLLYQMGLQANVQFITYRECKAYQDQQAVFAAMQDKLGALLPQEEKALHEYIGRTFVCQDGRWRRRVPHIIKWAVMWWDLE